MATTLGFKASSTSLGMAPRLRRPLPLRPVAAAYDKRNSERNAPFNYYLSSAAGPCVLPANDDGQHWPHLRWRHLWRRATAVFHPTAGPRGTIAAGATNTQFTLTTALPAAVAINQLANRGDGEGFGSASSATPRAAQARPKARQIIANTAGTTNHHARLHVTFTPANGDA